jgi:hypothetical protein
MNKTSPALSVIGGLPSTSSGGRERWHCHTGNCHNPYGLDQKFGKVQ